jgi:hypothetical protein
VEAPGIEPGSEAACGWWRRGRHRSAPLQRFSSLSFPRAVRMTPVPTRWARGSLRRGRAERWRSRDCPHAAWTLRPAMRESAERVCTFRPSSQRGTRGATLPRRRQLVCRDGTERIEHFYPARLGNTQGEELHRAPRRGQHACARRPRIARRHTATVRWLPRRSPSTLQCDAAPQGHSPSRPTSS